MKFSSQEAVNDFFKQRVIVKKLKIIKDRKLRIGVVGCGRISEKHFNAIEKHADDIELKAIMNFTQGNKKLKVSSTKSSIGHLLGAAGSVESIFSILSINNNVIPATLNLSDPSHSYEVDLVPKHSIDHSVNIALSNSFGFGGTNTALLFKSI